jgi:hypothetical protein
MSSIKTKNTLRILNLSCFIIHAGFCLFWIKKKRDNYIIPQDLKIYRTSIKNIDGDVKVTLKEEDSFLKFDLRNLLILFFGITSLTHLFYFLSSYEKFPLIGGFYEKMINNKNNFIRWIEYSITATTMINIVARSAGISEEDTILLTNLATVGVMLQGQTIEMALQEKRSRSKLYRLIIYNLVGWGLMLGVFKIIISKFTQTVDEIKKATCANIPDFVKYTIYSQFLFYNLFGLWQLYQIISVYKNPEYDYTKFEIGYTILSLLSKTILGSILGFGIDQSAKRDVNKKFSTDCNKTN